MTSPGSAAGPSPSWRFLAPALLLCPRQGASASQRARGRLGFGVEPGEAVARQSGLADGSPRVHRPLIPKGHPVGFGWCLVYIATFTKVTKG